MAPVSFQTGYRGDILRPGVIPSRLSNRRENPPDERYNGTTSLAPAFMRGEGHAVAGGVPRRSGKASSVTAAPCQLPQRGSQGRFAPFLPPAFMRGEGREAAGGVLRRSGDGPLSHGFAVTALPKGEPRALRAVPVRTFYVLSILADSMVLSR